MSNLKSIDAILSRAVESKAMPGVVTVAATDKGVLYEGAFGTPGITTCTNAALTTPLMFDPGDRWEYGINIDWVGKIVEAMSGQKLDRYFQEHIFGPLGIKDTSFKISPSQRARLATVHQRGE